MDSKETVEILAQTVLEEAGKNNALSVTLAGLLVALRDNPEVVKVVRTVLELRYADHLAQSQISAYMDGFERARDTMYAALAPGQVKS